MEIPYHYTLSRVSNVINNAIFKREDNKLKKLIHIHNTLTQCSLEGGGLERIARLMSALIYNPLIIVDSKWRLLAYADLAENPRPLKANLYLSKKERVFPQSFIKDVPREFGEFTKSIKRRYPDANGDVVCRILPVAADQSIYGYLVVWETMYKMTSVEYMALESCSTTVALERVKARQIEEIKHHLRQDFFDDLIQGKIESVNAASSLAEIHYMDVRKKYVCMLTKVAAPQGAPSAEGETDEGQLQERDAFTQYKERLIGLIDDISYERRRETVSIHRGNLIITFIRIHSGELGQRMSALLGDFVGAVYEAVKGADPHSDVGIAVGKPSLDFLEISKSYLQAKEALRISEQLDEDRHISFYEELMIYRLINSVQSREYLDEFCANGIGKLCRVRPAEQHQPGGDAGAVLPVQLEHQHRGEEDVPAPQHLYLPHREDKGHTGLGAEGPRGAVGAADGAAHHEGAQDPAGGARAEGPGGRGGVKNAPESARNLRRE